jgi:hypothetical protein
VSPVAALGDDVAVVGNHHGAQPPEPGGIVDNGAQVRHGTGVYRKEEGHQDSEPGHEAMATGMVVAFRHAAHFTMPFTTLEASGRVSAWQSFTRPAFPALPLACGLGDGLPPSMCPAAEALRPAERRQLPGRCPINVSRRFQTALTSLT